MDEQYLKRKLTLSRMPDAATSGLLLTSIYDNQIAFKLEVIFPDETNGTINVHSHHLTNIIYLTAADTKTINKIMDHSLIPTEIKHKTQGFFLHTNLFDEHRKKEPYPNAFHLYLIPKKAADFQIGPLPLPEPLKTAVARIIKRVVIEELDKLNPKQTTDYPLDKFSGLREKIIKFAKWQGMSDATLQILIYFLQETIRKPENKATLISYSPDNNQAIRANCLNILLEINKLIHPVNNNKALNLNDLLTIAKFPFQFFTNESQIAEKNILFAQSADQFPTNNFIIDETLIKKASGITLEI